MFCINCGAQLSAVANYCPNCGTPRPRGVNFCSNCGAPLHSGANFCFKCGCDLRNLSQRYGYSSIRPTRVGEYIIISRYGLDCIKYHDVYLTTIWEECYLRKWLNNDFMAMTFSKEDTKRIQVSELANDNNQKFGTYGGEVTKDRVFCLSIAEAVQYFKNNDERLCKPTAFAESHGALNYNGYCFWWLRSPGHDLDSAAFGCDQYAGKYGRPR